MSINWNSDAIHANPQLPSVTAGNKAVVSLKIGASALANLASLPAQAVGLVGGAIAGSGAALFALLTRKPIGEAFCENASKAASATTKFMSVIAFPLTAISYGLSRCSGEKGAFARSNLIINNLLRRDDVSKKMKEASDDIEGLLSEYDAKKAAGEGINANEPK